MYDHGELTPETHPGLFKAIEENWPMPPHEGPGDEDEVLCPPPDVFEFYRRHGRWPEEGEA